MFQFLFYFFYFIKKKHVAFFLQKKTLIIFFLKVLATCLIETKRSKSTTTTATAPNLEHDDDFILKSFDNLEKIFDISVNECYKDTRDILLKKLMLTKKIIKNKKSNLIQKLKHEIDSTPSQQNSTADLNAINYLIDLVKAEFKPFEAKENKKNLYSELQNIFSMERSYLKEIAENSKEDYLASAGDDELKSVFRIFFHDLDEAVKKTSELVKNLFRKEKNDIIKSLDVIKLNLENELNITNSSWWISSKEFELLAKNIEGINDDVVRDIHKHFFIQKKTLIRSLEINLNSKSDLNADNNNSTKSAKTNKVYLLDSKKETARKLSSSSNSKKNKLHELFEELKINDELLNEESRAVADGIMTKEAHDEDMDQLVGYKKLLESLTKIIDGFTSNKNETAKKL